MFEIHGQIYLDSGEVSSALGEGNVVLEPVWRLTKDAYVLNIMTSGIGREDTVEAVQPRRTSGGGNRLDASPLYYEDNITIKLDKLYDVEVLQVETFYRDAAIGIANIFLLENLLSLETWTVRFAQTALEVSRASHDSNFLELLFEVV